MKHCPECNRNYADPTLSFCLQDGAPLIFGPAADEPRTAILSGDSTREAPTRTFEPTPTARPSNEHAASNRRSVAIGMAVLFLSALGIGGYLYSGLNSPKQIDSIAVMPFVNESGNADLEYLSDGMTETLINSLMQLPNLNVQARSSVFRFKGKEVDARAIGRELNVQAILSGRVVQRSDGLTLYLELVDAVTGTRIWGEQYDRKQSDLVSLQREVARDVASKLQAKLTSADQQKLAKNFTSSPEAYQLYLQGQSYWNKRGLKNLEIAIGYYQQAIEKDQNYALAYAGLAETYAQPSLQPQGMPKALAAAQKALELDNDLAEAHTVYGRLLAIHDYDFARAERECLRAIELNPNYGAAHFRYGAILTWLGKFEAAEAENRRALELEPLSLSFNFNYGQMLVSARRYDEAIIQLKKTLELDDKFILTRPTLATAYRLKGDYRESIELLARDAEIKSDAEKAASIRESFAKGGWEGYLRYEISLVKPRPDSGERFGEARFNLATMYSQLGEKDKAFEALNDAYDNREWRLTRIKVDPLLDPLRDDPRFSELLKKVGFPE